jgi:hypothetical protein
MTRPQCGFFAIDSSIFASKIGSEHVVGLAGVMPVWRELRDRLRPLTYSW